MKIHEYQAKEIFRKFGVPTPAGHCCFSADEIAACVDKIAGGVWVLKAQIHAGGRGKGGGVKVAKTAPEARKFGAEILGMNLITHQTGAGGQTVRRLLIEEGAAIAQELYVGLVTDRARQQAVIMASSEGGMEIEEVAAKTADKIHKVWFNQSRGIGEKTARELAQKIGAPEAAVAATADLMMKLCKIFDDTDATLMEVNPLVITADEQVLALDGKMNFDDNALFRQPEIAELRDWDEENAAEVEAAKFDLSYIELDGNIGCMVNGAGLAMATMDIIKLFGGEPANFLDVGGGATAEKVAAAFSLMLRNSGIRAILINIFGGIMRCDVIAEGVVKAAKQTKLTVPLVVRLEGTNVELGKKILAESGLAIIAADTMADAAKKAVTAAG